MIFQVSAGCRNERFALALGTGKRLSGSLFKGASVLTTANAICPRCNAHEHHLDNSVPTCMLLHLADLSHMPGSTSERSTVSEAEVRNRSGSQGIHCPRWLANGVTHCVL